MATEPTAEASEGRPAVIGGGPKPRWRRLVVRLAGVVLLVYVGGVAIFASFQARLIFPGSETQGRPESDVPAMPGSELVTLTTTRGDRVVALFGPALGPDGSPLADAPTRPTILYFYGNAMCLADSLDDFERLRRLGANVMIPDYAGYGMSGGEVGELGCRETAEAALAHLQARPDVDRGRIVLAGWSLGGGVAIDLASRHEVAGLATFCTFTSMADMARRLFPLLPASLLLRHRFDNLAKVAKIDCPTFIGHGRRDGIIPFDMADRLAGAAKGPVTRVTIDDANHNDFFWVGGRRVMGPFRLFLEGLPRRP